MTADPAVETSFRNIVELEAHSKSSTETKVLKDSIRAFIFPFSVKQAQCNSFFGGRYLLIQL